MTRAAIYARVSSAAQRESHTIANQLRVLPAYVAAQGWTLVETYVDDGRSAKAGQLDRRDGFARLLAAAEARKFDAVVVVDVDRLTRTNSIEERAEILGPFQRLGIQIVTPSGGALDLRSFLGEFWVTVQALVAAEENRKRADRIKAGKDRAISEGRKPAGPTPYGLSYSRAAGAWSVDDGQARVVREIVRRVADGVSCNAIANDLEARGVPGPTRLAWVASTVYRIVRSRHLVGEWTADKRRGLRMPVPRIVADDAYQAAQDALSALGRRGLRRTRHVYLLEGLATCGACGAPIHIRSAMSGGRRRAVVPAAYLCRDRKSRRERGNVVRCAAPIVLVADLDARVWGAVVAAVNSSTLADDLARLAKERAADRRDWAADVEAYRRKLERLDAHEQRVLVRGRRGDIGEVALDAELAACRRERKALRDQLATAQRGARQEQAAAPLASPAQWLDRIRRACQRAAPEQRRALVAELLAGAVLRGRELHCRLSVPTAIGAVALAERVAYSTQHEESHTIQLVA